MKEFSKEHLEVEKKFFQQWLNQPFKIYSPDKKINAIGFNFKDAFKQAIEDLEYKLIHSCSEKGFIFKQIVDYQIDFFHKTIIFTYKYLKPRQHCEIIETELPNLSESEFNFFPETCEYVMFFQEAPLITDLFRFFDIDG